MAFPIPPQQVPRALTEYEVAAIAQRHATEYTQLLERITTGVDVRNATFENTVLAIASLENAQTSERMMVKAMKYSSPSLSVQKACEKAEAQWRGLGHSQRAELYRLVTSARAADSQLQSTEVIRLAGKMISDLEELGFSNLSDESAERVRENKEGIKRRCVVFLRNLRQEERSIEANADELDGVFDQLKNIHAVEGDGQPQSFQVPYAGNYNAIMRNAHSAEVRERMYEIHSTRYNKNMPIFKEIILLRDETARLLGYENHAELRLRDRLATSVADVNVLLNSTLDRLQQHRESNAMKKPKVSESVKTEKETIKEAPWDKAYNKAKMPPSEAKIVVGGPDFAEYFPLWHTFRGIIELVQDVLELKFEPIAASVLLEANWYDEVKGWKVWEEEPKGGGCDFVGYLLVDLQNRPHKYKGNQSVNLQPGYTREDGTRAYPANLLMCCFDASPSDHDYLLSHDNIRTLFHELGHSMHDLLARTRFAKQHGYNVKRELGEAIGFTFEQWAWTEKELKAISCHYSLLTHSEETDRQLGDRSKAEIPDDILKRSLERQAPTKRYHTTGGLIQCLFDMAVHTPPTHQALLDMDEAAVWRDIACRLTGMSAPSISDTAYVEAGLLVSGYDAGYYTYIYADVVAANLVSSVFGTDPRSKQAWSRFRREILEKGGSEDEYMMLKRVLGYPPGDTTEYFKMLGLSA